MPDYQISSNVSLDTEVTPQTKLDFLTHTFSKITKNLNIPALDFVFAPDSNLDNIALYVKKGPNDLEQRGYPDARYHNFDKDTVIFDTKAIGHTFATVAYLALHEAGHHLARHLIEPQCKEVSMSFANSIVLQNFKHAANLFVSNSARLTYHIIDTLEESLTDGLAMHLALENGIPGNSRTSLTETVEFMLSNFTDSIKLLDDVKPLELSQLICFITTGQSLSSIGQNYNVTPPIQKCLEECIDGLQERLIKDKSLSEEERKKLAGVLFPLSHQAFKLGYNFEEYETTPIANQDLQRMDQCRNEIVRDLAIELATTSDDHNKQNILRRLSFLFNTTGKVEQRSELANYFQASFKENLPPHASFTDLLTETKLLSTFSELFKLAGGRSDSDFTVGSTKDQLANIHFILDS